MECCHSDCCFLRLQLVLRWLHFQMVVVYVLLANIDEAVEYKITFICPILGKFCNVKTAQNTHQTSLTSCY